ncbi:MAG: hypothetical protein PHS48_10125 [Bacteroidales bacterium]|nr:hypothetical protein [Bacteroidales bacterium]
MKKIIFTASSLIFAISLYVGVNAYTNSNLANDLLLSNVEALTQGEFYGRLCYPIAEPNQYGGTLEIVCRDGNYSCEEEKVTVPIIHAQKVCL